MTKPANRLWHPALGVVLLRRQLGFGSTHTAHNGACASMQLGLRVGVVQTPRVRMLWFWYVISSWL